MDEGRFLYVPLNSSGFKMAMGLRPLDEKDWFKRICASS